MSLKLIRKGIFNKIKQGSNIISVIIFIVFLFGSFILLKNVSATEEELPNYYELTKNPYREYEELIKKTNAKKLIESEQFIEMKYNNDLMKGINIDDIEKGKNPFSKMF